MVEGHEVYRKLKCDCVRVLYGLGKGLERCNCEELEMYLHLGWLGGES